MKPITKTLIVLPVGTICLTAMLYLVFTLSDLVDAFTNLDMSNMFTHPAFCWERARFAFGLCFTTMVVVIAAMWAAHWLQMFIDKE